jgi:hypothetical protein
MAYVENATDEAFDVIYDFYDNSKLEHKESFPKCRKFQSKSEDTSQQSSKKNKTAFSPKNVIDLT